MHWSAVTRGSGDFEKNLTEVVNIYDDYLGSFESCHF